MEITLNELEPIDTYPYLEVGSGQSNSGELIILYKELPIYLGEFKNQKSTIDFLIIYSDLQGAIEIDGEYKLLWEELPAYLNLLLQIELDATEQSQSGVLLCGDMFTNLDKRGSDGDVRSVWKEFNNYFDWVAGVAGNHDRFGDEKELEAFNKIENVFLLHNQIKELNNLTIGGISGIIGRGDKINRVKEEEYLKALKGLLKKNLDFILLHETPDFPKLKLKGNTKIRTVIENEEAGNIFCGHCHWGKTLAKFEKGSIVMNVDSKVVILRNTKGM